MISRTRHLPILNYYYTVILYKDPSELIKRFPKVEFTTKVEDFQAGCFEYDDRYYIVFLDDNKITPGIVAHECNHFMNQLYTAIGHQPNPDNDELESYFLNHVVDKVSDIFKIEK